MGCRPNGRHETRRRKRAIVAGIAAALLAPTLSEPAVTYAQDDTISPRSWRYISWHYPVAKRPPNERERAAAIDRQIEEAPTVRIAGGEYEIATFGIHVAEIQRIVLDARGVSDGYTFEIYYLPPITIDRKSRWFDPPSTRGAWFDPLVPLHPVPGASEGPNRGVYHYDVRAVDSFEGAYFLLEIRAPRGGNLGDSVVRLYAETRAERQSDVETQSPTRVFALPPLTIQPFGFDLPLAHSLPVLAGIVPDDLFDLHRSYGLLPRDELDLWLRYLALLREHRIVPYDPLPTEAFDWDAFESIAIPLYEGKLTPDGVPAPAIRFPDNPYPRGTPERTRFYRDVAGRLAAAGLLERAFYYLDDEPLLDDYTQLIADAEEIERIVPGLRRLVTESYNPALAGAVDVWCPDIAMFDPPAPFFPFFGKGSGLHPDFQMNPNASVYDSATNDDSETWMYTCMSALYADLPNLFIDTDSASNRIIPWVVYHNEAGGLLYYRVTQAYKRENDPWKNQRFFSVNGDGTLVYPAHPDLPWFEAHDAVPSLRMKILRDGLEDVEYLLLREELIGPASRGIAVATERDVLLDEVSDVEHIVALREAIGREIEDAHSGGAAIERFHHVSQPGLFTDLWVVPNWANPENRIGLFNVLGYRHNLASVLDTGRSSSTVSTRGRWQAYIEVGPIVGIDRSLHYGGYSAIGWTVSLESARRLDRRWFIPYVGVEGGIITGARGDSTATGFAGTAMVGIHLVSTPKASISIGGGWTHTTLGRVPIAFRGMVGFEFAID